MIMLADAGESTAAMLLARTSTPDPLGEWRMTRISPSAIGRDFDFPIMAAAGRSLAISVNVYRGPAYEKTANYVIPLSTIHSATGSPIIRVFDDFLSTSAPTADSDPNRSRVLFVNSSVFLQSGNYALAMRNVEVNPAGEITPGSLVAGSAADIARFVGRDIMPQLGTETRIDAGDATIQNCVARGNTVRCVNSVVIRFGMDVRSVVQYYGINWPAAGDPVLIERVRIDDSTGVNQYAFPSIAVNKNNEILIGYNRFSRTEYAGAYFAFRKPTDQPGALFIDGLLKAGEDSYVKGLLSNRWGDYSTTLVDPADDTSFWTLQEYAASRTESGTSLWGTYWTKLAPRNGPCNVRLDRPSIDLPNTAGTFRVQATVGFADCGYLVQPNASWINQSARNTLETVSNFDFQVGLNRRPVARTATITIGNSTFAVRQAANSNPPPAEPMLSVLRFEASTSARVGDSVNVSATVRNIGTRGAGRFRIAFYLSTKLPVTSKDIFSGFGCPQSQGLVPDEVVSCNGSFQLDASLEPGNYFLAAIADDREEVVMTDRSIASRLSDLGAVTVLPSANAPSLTSAGVVNGATALAGPVSPGGILVIYGSRLGPAALTTLRLDAQGRVATTLAGTRILFDGVPAPLIYTSSGQVSVIAPYSLAGRTTSQMVAELNGVKSLALTVPVSSVSPGLFSVDFSGRNQVAALNENGSVNGPGNGAERGKLLVLYGSGSGTFRSNPVDGAVIGLPLPELLFPLSVQIGGREAEILYSGPAPGLVSGVFQINARVPDGIEPGDRVSIRVRSGTTDSPVGTTIAVK